MIFIMSRGLMSEYLTLSSTEYTISKKNIEKIRAVAARRNKV
jgi:hypothetical protein